MSHVNPVPEGMHTVTPHLICANIADAIDFYRAAFNAVELARLPGPNGALIHACIKIGDSAVMLAEENRQYNTLSPKTLSGSPVILHLYVEAVDAFIDHAVSKGAALVMPAADMFWGDRYGQVDDPFGHRWSVATHIRDLTPEEITRAARQMPC